MQKIVSIGISPTNTELKNGSTVTLSLDEYIDISNITSFRVSFDRIKVYASSSFSGNGVSFSLSKQDAGLVTVEAVCSSFTGSSIVLTVSGGTGSLCNIRSSSGTLIIDYAVKLEKPTNLTINGISNYTGSNFTLNWQGNDSRTSVYRVYHGSSVTDQVNGTSWDSVGTPFSGYCSDGNRWRPVRKSDFGPSENRS